ncbi:MAG: DUF4280 domain-containing protein [Caldilineaceae bacterium]|nr:DUF4280 domain-containing protein [Caldilineaceae bacterium]
MALQVVHGATLQCSFGTSPSNFVITPEKQVGTGAMQVASVMEHVPMKNIMPFGMCITLSNPQVAAATSAALGVLTPQPCIPVTTQPWAPGSPMVAIRSQPALNNSSTCLCQWGGVIAITNPGQTKVTIP